MAFLGRTAATGAGLFAGGAAASQARRDFVEVTQPPDDSITSVRFSPKANFLVATSWDNNVGRIIVAIGSKSFLFRYAAGKFRSNKASRLRERSNRIRRPFFVPVGTP